MTEERQSTVKRGVVGTLARLLPRGGTAAAPPPKVAPPHPLLNNSVVDCGLYVDGVREPGLFDFASAYAVASRRQRTFVWLGLHEPDPVEFGWVAKIVGLHESAIQEATSANHRPKVERIGDCVKFVLRTARYVEHAELSEWSEVVETGHIMIFLGPRFVITVRHGSPGALKEVRADLEKRRPLLAMGPWAVAYRICDRLVSTYLDVADAVDDDVLALEEAVFARHRSEHIAHIYQMKRELMEFRRAVLPLQRPMQQLVDDHDDIAPGLRRQFRDVSDHLSRCVDQTNAYDELLNSILQARLAQLTVDQNNDMRKIAAYAAMAAVPTVIAGVYGMNFDHMPELRWQYGYFMVLALMAGAVLGMYRAFRRSGWL